ncbi:MAG: chromate transporter [Bacillota bacterium]
MIYLILYCEFFRVGLFSLGGGLVALPFLQELIAKYGWMTGEELLNMIAISESTPGAIGINTATFIGYNTAGISGSIVATIGLATPSVIIIVIIARYFNKFNQHPLVQAAFRGLKPAVAGLIASAAFTLASGEVFKLRDFELSSDLISAFDLSAVSLLILILVGLKKLDLHPVVYIFSAAVIGVIFKF